VVISNQFLLSFDTVSGQTYVVEYKNALSNGNWNSLETTIGDGTTRTVTNDIAASPQRFYRVRLQ
jgi:hypothetical protein